jgi:hypothetical protein
LSGQLQMIRWYRPNFGSAAIHVAELQTKEKAFVISKLEPHQSPWRTLDARGYQTSEDGQFLYKIYGEADKMVAKGDLDAAFPKLSIVNFFRSFVYLSEDQFREIAAEVRRIAPIGMNYLGHSVYETAGRRYTVDQDDVQHVEGKNALEQPEFFLRTVGDQPDFSLIADGFTQRMALGTVMRPQDVRRLLNITRNQVGFAPETDPQLRRLQEAIEASSQRRVAREFASTFAKSGVNQAAFDFAQKLYLNQPTAQFRSGSSVQNQQYSTPLPMSLGLQALLGDTSKITVLEPTIGNGSLVMGLPDGTDILGYEIDAARVEQASALNANIRLHHGDFTRVAVDIEKPIRAVISNPPFGGLDKDVQFDGLKVSRLDYLIALKALASREDKGVGTFIVGADRENIFSQKAGKMDGSTHSFLKYLSDNYDILDVVECSGSLYAKQGSTYPVRVITVGNRLSPAEVNSRSQERSWRMGGEVIKFKDDQYRLPVVHTYDEFWEHITELRNTTLPILAEAAEPAAKATTETTEIKGDAPSTVVGGVSNQNDQTSLFADEPATPAAEQPVAVEQEAQADAATPQAEQQPDPKAAIDQRMKAKELELNKFQRPYVPFSSGTSTSMIPANLASAVDSAMNRYIERVGMGVDQYVKENCFFDDLGMEVLMPEQKDAIFLALCKRNEGSGFIIGDQTGRGKGVTQASVMRSSLKSGRTVVFITEKENLFSDMCRDLTHINSWDLVKPMILNSDAKIVAPDRRVVATPPSSAEMTRVMDAVIAGDATLAEQGVNVVFATYSQFNRVGNKKSTFLNRLCETENVDLYLDESHNAAGDSTTHANVLGMVNAAASVLYSSATYAKNATNMIIYGKAFPDSVNMETLGETLASGGETLLEILSERLAQNGSYIRRESDSSRLEVSTYRDEANYQRNIDFNDKHCKILRKMSYISGDIEETFVSSIKNQMEKDLKQLSDEQRKGNRMGVQYSNFGSRLYNLLQQFLLTVKVDAAIQVNLDAIKRGCAPINFVTTTNEQAILNFFEASRNADVTNAKPTDEEAENTLDEIEDGLFAAEKEESPEPASQFGTVDGIFADADTYPLYSYADLLERMLNRLTTITTTDMRGNVKVEDARTIYIDGADPEEMARLHQNFEDNIEAIRKEIRELPYFPISPIDAINQAIEEYQPQNVGDAFNFKTAEVSGRKNKFRVLRDESGKPIAMKRMKVDTNRNREINRFNDGEAQAITITLAGSTGCSLHASKTFKNQARREYNELQIATDPNKRAQGRGRADRTGQVSDPLIRTFMTGLVAEDRLLAMANAKDRAKAAMTQSNRRNQFEIEEVPDILNWFGELIVRNTMSGRPDLCNLLGIDSEDFESNDSEQENWFVNRVFSRLALLENDVARALVEQIYSEYNQRLAEKLALGETLFSTKELRVKARKVSDKLIAGVRRETYESSFDEPVEFREYEWDEAVDPIRFERIQKLANESLEQINKDYGVTLNRATYSFYKDSLNLNGYREQLTENINQNLLVAKGKKYETVAQALAASENNLCKKLNERKELLERLAPMLVPGGIVSFTDSLKGKVSGVLASVKFPEPDKLHMLGEYKLKIAVPGDTHFTEMSLYSLSEDDQFMQETTLQGRGKNDLAPIFDDCPKGTVTRQANFLCGNLFKAVEMSVQKNLGRAVVLELEDGTLERMVLLKNGVDLHLIQNQPIELLKPAIVERYIRLMRELTPKASVILSTRQIIGAAERKRDISVELTVTGDYAYTLSIPGTKEHAGSIMTDEELKALFGTGSDFNGTRARMTMTSNSNSCQSVQEVIKHLYKHNKVQFKSNGENFEEVNLLVSTKDDAELAAELDEESNSEQAMA